MVLQIRRSAILTGLLLSVTLPLASCANSSFSSSLERSLAADPRLQDNSPVFGANTTDTTTPTLRATASLPPDFPSEIPLLPGAALQSVQADSTAATPDGTTAENPTILTRWLTTKSLEEVRQFYQQEFPTKGWQIESGSSEGGLTATQKQLWAEVKLAQASEAPASPEAAKPTEFTLAYRRVEDGGAVEASPSDATTQSPAPSTSAAPNATATGSIPQPGDPNFIGPVLPSSVAQADTSSPAPSVAASAPQAFTDLSEAPAELRQYITDLAALGALPLNADGTAQDTAFKPNDAITRREFARWLVAANNRIYRDRPANQIRLGNQSDEPAFQDVPRTDPDFGAIQGLASAGIVPSALSGNSTEVTFRPDAPLTREDLILWKTPLDTRQALPNATIDAVQQTWGFQDAARIEPKSLRAVLSDFQNSDFSNIRRAFGYTTLFQPKKAVSRAEAAAVLWHFGSQGEGISAKDALSGQQQPGAAQG